MLCLFGCSWGNSRGFMRLERLTTGETRWYASYCMNLASGPGTFTAADCGWRLSGRLAGRRTAMWHVDTDHFTALALRPAGGENGET